jgi:hypothetical protein
VDLAAQPLYFIILYTDFVRKTPNLLEVSGSATKRECKEKNSCTSLNLTISCLKDLNDHRGYRKREANEKMSILKTGEKEAL